MRWLTKTEISRRAKKSYKEALLVSIEHHQQIAQSTRKEFFAAVGLGKVSISGAHCGVCLGRIGDDCTGCFLGSGASSGCGSHWKAINQAIHDIITGDSDDRLTTWSAVVKAERKMVKRLRKELAKQRN